MSARKKKAPSKSPATGEWDGTDRRVNHELRELVDRFDRLIETTKLMIGKAENETMEHMRNTVIHLATRSKK